MSESLYTQIGERPSLEKLVHYFYQLVLDDDLLMPYFRNVDISKLISHQVDFFAAALGGPEYTHKMLQDAHKNMHITEEAFFRTIEHLSRTLDEFGLAESTKADILNLVHSQKPAIVNL